MGGGIGQRRDATREMNRLETDSSMLPVGYQTGFPASTQGLFTQQIVSHAVLVVRVQGHGCATQGSEWKALCHLDLVSSQWLHLEYPVNKINRNGIKATLPELAKSMASGTHSFITIF